MDTPRTPAVALYEIGATVTAADGLVGTLREVLVDTATGAPSVLVVQPNGGGSAIDVPLGLVDAAASTARDVRLATDRETLGLAGVATSGGELAAVGDRLVVQVREEVLQATTSEVEVGTVRIEKRVEIVPFETTVDAMMDDVTIKRVEVNRQVASAPVPRHEGDTLVIPVVEEVIVTEKRLMLREEIRVTRRRVAKPVTVREDVRREVVEIHDPEGTGYHAGGVTRASTPTPSLSPDTGDDGITPALPPS